MKFLKACEAFIGTDEMCSDETMEVLRERFSKEVAKHCQELLAPYSKGKEIHVRMSIRRDKGMRKIGAFLEVGEDFETLVAIVEFLIDQQKFMVLSRDMMPDAALGISPTKPTLH